MADALSKCCGAPMVELLQPICSNCGTDAETADGRCKHGVRLGTICEMCDYDVADEAERVTENMEVDQIKARAVHGEVKQ